ncbi:hypothetical protein D3C71_1902070 [compost metagenome]
MRKKDARLLTEAGAGFKGRIFRKSGRLRHFVANRWSSECEGRFYAVHYELHGKRGKKDAEQPCQDRAAGIAEKTVHAFRDDQGGVDEGHGEGEDENKHDHFERRFHRSR